ncbi:MAG: LytTR family DNA-binding domain-containing protein [Synoicihabitans sp.]
MSQIRRALIVDDEPLARVELRRLLLAHPHIEITGEADTLNAAKERMGTPDFDLVFLDIQLRGGTGFDLLPHVPPQVQVIFVTAYDRYAVRAFEVNALDYLLKPVTAERLAETLRRLEDEPLPRELSTATALSLDDRVFVKSGTTTRFVPVNQIVSIGSCENYTELQLADGQKLMALRTLKSWEESLPEAIFVRIHRQTLVNLQHVRAIERGEGDLASFQFEPGLPDLPASRRRLADLRHRLKAAGLERLES